MPIVVPCASQEERVYSAARSQSESDWRHGCFSGSEVERRHVADRRVPLEVPPRSKPKKAAGKPSKGARRYSCAIGLRELLGLLAVIGPLGTLVSLWVLPESGSSGMNVHLRRPTGTLERARVIHLTLAGNERKARFVLSREVEWQDFLSGVQERLQLGGIDRIEVELGVGRLEARISWGPLSSSLY